MKRSFAIRTDRLALLVAILQLGLGIGVFASPSSFTIPFYASLVPHFRLFSSLMMAGGALLFLHSRYRVSVPWQSLITLISAGSLGWLDSCFISGGNWPFFGGLTAVILATLLLPWLSHRARGQGQEYDLCLITIGLGEMVMGALMLLAPYTYQAPGLGGLVRHLPWMGPLGLVGGLVLILPMPAQSALWASLRWLFGALFMGVFGWFLAGPASLSGIIVLVAWFAVPLTFHLPVPEPADLPKLLTAGRGPLDEDSIAAASMYQEIHSWILIAVVVVASLVAPGYALQSPLLGPLFVVTTVACNLVLNWLLVPIVSPEGRLFWHALIHIAALGFLFADAGSLSQPLLISLFIWPVGVQCLGTKTARTALGVSVLMYTAASLIHRHAHQRPTLAAVASTATVALVLVPMGELAFRALQRRRESARALQRQLNQTAMMVRIADAVHRSLDIEQIVAATAQELGDAMKATRSFIMLEPDSAEEPLLYHWVDGKVSPMSDPNRHLVHFVTTMLRPDQTVALDDLMEGEWLSQLGPAIRHRVNETGTRSVIVTPVIMEGKTVGGIGSVDGPEIRKWLPEETGFIEAVALQVGIALSHARAHKELAYLADHDTLTGLINRRRFQISLASELTRFREGGVRGALLFLDLDQFKYVNDTMGHPAGDALLEALSSTLSGMIESAQTLARIGGDEFAVLLPGADKVAAEQAAGRIQATLRQTTFDIGGRAVSATVSTGVVLYPEHGLSVDDLLARADIAVYQAKDLGRDQYQVYLADSSQQEAMKAQVDWERRIKAALVEDRLLAYSQPILSLDKRQITGQELLVRMMDEEGAILPPADFLGAAERSALIREIDGWMIAQAIQQVRRNEQAHLSLQVNVNLSGKSLTDPGLLSFVQAQLKQSGIKPKSLVFEITETAIVSDMGRALSHIEALRALGCGFALDDFGSGFSSFSHLLSLPLDCLKIDGQFVQTLHTSKRSQAFVRAVVELGQSLGMAVTAEFVEQERTAALLRSYGVMYAQGHLFGTPQPLALVTAEKTN